MNRQGEEQAERSGAAPASAPGGETLVLSDAKTLIGLRGPGGGRGDSPAAEGFVLHVVTGGAHLKTGADIRVDSRSAILGRSAECTIVITEPDVSRTHVRIDRVANGFRLIDLGSTGGVWIGSRQVRDELIAEGEEFCLSHRLVFTCRAMAAPAGTAPATAAAEESATVQLTGMQLSAAQLTAVPPVGADGEASRFRFETEGEHIDADPHAPFSPDDPASVWYVATGGLLLFTTRVQPDQPQGTRTHLLDVPAGQALFGFDLLRYGLAHRQAAGAGFAAVAKPGTTLRRIPLTRLRTLATRPDGAADVARLLDAWIAALAKSLARDLPPRRADDGLLKPGEPLAVAPQARASSAGGVVWVEIWSGSVLVDDLAVPAFARRRTLLPLTPDAWIQPVGDDLGTLTVTPVRTLDALANPMLWQGLAIFHEVLCECVFLNKQFATADEFVRLRQKAAHAQGARDAAYDAIGSVLRPESDTPREFLAPSAAEPVLRGCQLVGRALGLTVKPHPSASEELTHEERVTAIAAASGFRTRIVALRETWWTSDNGPLLAQHAHTTAPVALLPTGAHGYDAVDPMTGARTAVDAAVAAALTPFACTFYRPFPDGELTVGDLIRFGARGLAPDLRLVVLTAVAVGLFGTITPYLTGRIFDAAIPQADRATLYGFGLALGGSAIATALFKLVQGIATVRAQTRMEAGIQAALWDRLLTLPANFFRRFSAGDLADRAAGVDAIQTLISGAGVSAILGSLSGLFFIVQMFMYNLRLALLAVALTALFVGTTMLANYLQLRYQRVEVQIRGRIAGMVLNLITGVTKLRLCGAEPHAFRVWAQQFAAQRRLTFKAGAIKAGATTFSAVFPVLSSIGMFLVMLTEQRAAAEGGGRILTTGEFIAFTTSYGLFVAAMQALGDASLNLLRIVPIYERLQPIITTAPEVDRTKMFPGVLKGDIELSHVHFRYGEDGPWVLKDVSLKIAPGEFVAFVGGSGCGKSTLLRLMLGFERPTSGAIYFDGQDLSALDVRMVRQQMGVVLQVSRVMPTDIYRNIVGMSARTIDDAWIAAEMAGLAADVRNMPMGMHTYVAEGGGTLSGGQRQRLLIARAIVHRPKILFLDEATSALDNRTQSIVTDSMKRLDATRIVIAHRLSTIVDADRICYLEGGRIAEMGTYEELMAKNGLFAQLARRQMA